jgi:hypothetical protein
MSDIPDEVLQRAWDAAYLAWVKHPTSDEDCTSDEAAKAAMRGVLEAHLGQACTDNTLQNELLDLIKLMPESQTQEIVDFIYTLRAARGAVTEAAMTTQDRRFLATTLRTLTTMLVDCKIYHPSGELSPIYFIDRLRHAAGVLDGPGAP